MATTKTRTNRINLNVPFWHGKGGKNKAAALVKALGAYFDYTHKVWYTYAGVHNLDAFRRFMSDADIATYLA